MRAFPSASIGTHRHESARPHPSLRKGSSLGMTTVWARPVQPRLLDRLQFLAGFEADRLAGRDVDFRAGARVASDAGLARPHGEDAEAAQLNAVTVRQSLLHAFENGFDRHFGLGFGDAGLVDDFVDQVQFDHKWLRYVLSPLRQPVRELIGDCIRPARSGVSLSSTSSYKLIRAS